MVFSSCFNNLLLKVILKSNAITTKSKSKFRIKKGSKFYSLNNGRLTLGSRDRATSNFKHSGFNLKLLENSKLFIFGNVLTWRRKIAEVHHFMYLSTITKDLNNFFRAMHIFLRTRHEIAFYILGGQKFEDFGITLTKDNIEKFIREYPKDD